MPLTIKPESDFGDLLLRLKNDSITGEYGMEIPYDLIKMVQAEIYNQYGDVTEYKGKQLNKYGENLDITTSEADIMTLPSGILEETWLFTNGITHVSSASAADVGITFDLEGHTISGTDYTFEVQSVTLNGQNKVALSTPLRNASRIKNLSAANAGRIYVYEDTTISAGVPVDGSKVHLIGEVGENASLRASFTVSSQDYYVALSYYGSVIKNSAAAATLRLKTRQYQRPFRTLRKIPVFSRAEATRKALGLFEIIPKNSDVKLTGVGESGGSPMSGGIDGFLMKVRT